MGYKIKSALKNGRKLFIVLGILWVLLSIVFVSPTTVSIVEAKKDGIFNVEQFMDNMITSVGKIPECMGKTLKPEYFITFLKTEGWTTIVLLLFALVGFIKSMPKNEYSDIEHGSSDWARGEEYRILNRKKGILLAEDHYLPVDKRGNTNILVVGRLWFSENLHHMLFQMLISY